ncbi:MAG: trypsin-like peptidase domain-containing protein [Rhodomicrobium sp.]
MTVHRSHRLFVGAGLFALASFASGVPSAAFEQESGQPFAAVASRVRNSVVTVAAAVIDKRAIAMRGKKGAGGEERNPGSEPQDDFSPARPKQMPGEPPRQFTSIGSGFVVDPSGLIVTNNHVIEGGNTIYVILSDGTELKVDKVVGRDPKSDITVLKVTPKASKPLAAVPFGDSSRARVGDWVLAIGNPFGLDGTVTAGILSGRGRDINAGPYDDFLQTDAAINRGNSGGPLFNASGEVIGINTAIFSPSGGSIGLGFAIPSNTARRIVDQLERYGETRWGWIGVRLQTPSDDWAAGMHLPKAEGALIARIDKGGPAASAGLTEGDLVLSFAGSRIKHARQLPRFIAQAPIGQEVEAVILRGGERKTLRIKVGRLESASASELTSAPPARTRRQKVGKISFESLSESVRQRFVVAADAEGAVVTGGSVEFAAGEPLQPGDVVLEAAQQRIRTADELETRLAELRGLGRTEALLTIEKPGGSIAFATLPLGGE